MPQPSNTTRAATVIARQMRLSGQVQGLGIRPAVARLAERLELAGWVANSHGGVEIFVEGDSRQVKEFAGSLANWLPPGANLERIDVHPSSPVGSGSFRIAQPDAPTDEPMAVSVPGDLAMCADCRNEIGRHGLDVPRTIPPQSGPTNTRRVDYAFTSCTSCGPRYTIIEEMPYERRSTAMREFDMCDDCRAEFESSRDRRFHAQTNACRNCGPQIELVDVNGDVRARDRHAIAGGAEEVRAGRIVALKGIGGYQLLVDATNESAVSRLRQRKGRKSKPLAVMVPNIDCAKRIAIVRETEQRALESAGGPIVLLAPCSDTTLAPSVTCGLGRVGLMLPTTPLHWLLLDQLNAPVVCTSGNREGAPIEYQRESAQERLADIADTFLHHDRRITRPIDDSVVQIIHEQLSVIRLGRGYAPLRLKLPRELTAKSETPIVALGGHQKSAIAIYNGGQAALGPHVGDLDSLATRERYLQHRQRLCELYGVEVDHVETCCDSHPDFFTTLLAERSSDEPVQTQHHHAHILSSMLEAGWLDREVLGFAFDGTGWADDGTIWGGEVMRATVRGFERVTQLRGFPLLGGERAIREPWRVAMALVADTAGVEAAGKIPLRDSRAADMIELLARFVVPPSGGMSAETGTQFRSNPGRTTPSFAPITTSAGRLFDGAACLILGIEHVDFEGQAAMLLESACDLTESGSYEFTNEDDLDWRPVIRSIMVDCRSGISPNRMAMRFHRGLADMIAATCRKYASLPVVLSGGVFQNQVLTELVAEQLGDRGQPVALPGMIPVNDGGLAAGQLVYGMYGRVVQGVACKEERSRSDGMS